MWQYELGLLSDQSLVRCVGESMEQNRSPSSNICHTCRLFLPGSSLVLVTGSVCVFGFVCVSPSPTHSPCPTLPSFASLLSPSYQT